jgi:major type 1 subunit fimbrin (pilin)
MFIHSEIQNMNLKPTLLAVGLAVACGGLAIAPAALAADSGLITINGKVLNGTCSVDGNGSGSNNFTITLPDVQSSAFGSTVGTVAGPQPFTLKLTGCPTVPSSGVSVGAQFNAATVTASGDLTNASVPGSATGVGVRLLDSSNAQIVLAAGVNSAVTDPAAITVSGSPAAAAPITLNYTAEYISTATSVGAGSVATTVNYLINYQ